MKNPTDQLTPSEMGQLSWKSRKKGKTKKQISEMMRRAANVRHHGITKKMAQDILDGKFDKDAIPTRNV
jgi:hypothetical protein